MLPEEFKASHEPEKTQKNDLSTIKSMEVDSSSYEGVSLQTS